MNDEVFKPLGPWKTIVAFDAIVKLFNVFDQFS